MGGAVAPVSLDSVGHARVTVTATAGNGISLAGGAGGLQVTSVTATAGDVSIVVPDNSASGQDIALGTGSIRAAAGNIDLNAGDAVTMSDGGSIVAAKVVTIESDLTHQDPLGGALVKLTDFVAGTGVTVTGGAGQNIFDLEGVRALTTIVTGPANNATVNVGSNALAGNGNTGGTLLKVVSALIVHTGSGQATINLDDSGDTANTPAGAAAHFANGVVTIPGVNGTITAQGSDIVNFAAGSGSVVLDVDGTNFNQTTNLKLGAGTDAVTVGTGRLSTIAGPVAIVGNAAGNGTLALRDGADTLGTGNVGTISAGGLTGFGVTPSATAAGITWSNLAAASVTLAAGAVLRVSGEGQATAINATKGAATVNIDADLTAFIQAMTITGAANKLSLNVTSEVATPLTVSTSVSGVTTILGTGGTGPNIAASGVTALGITQPRAKAHLTVNELAAALSVAETGGGGTVAVNGANGAAITLAKGGNSVTVTDASAAVSVSGGTGDTLTIDRSASSVAQTGTISGGPATRTITGLLSNSAAVTATGLGAIDVLLGQGNNSFTVSDSLNATSVAISGGAGNDGFLVTSIGTSATDFVPPTEISGGGGTDTLTVQINTAPKDAQFTKLRMNGIDTLIVDNSGYTAAPVSWERDATPTGIHLVVGSSAAPVAGRVTASIWRQASRNA